MIVLPVSSYLLPPLTVCPHLLFEHVKSASQIYPFSDGSILPLFIELPHCPHFRTLSVIVHLLQPESSTTCQPCIAITAADAERAIIADDITINTFLFIIFKFREFLTRHFTLI